MMDPGADEADIKPMTDDPHAEIIDLDALDALPDLMASEAKAAQPPPSAGGKAVPQLPPSLPAADQEAPSAPPVKQEEVKKEGTLQAEVKDETGRQVSLEHRQQEPLNDWLESVHICITQV